MPSKRGFKRARTSGPFLAGGQNNIVLLKRHTAELREILERERLSCALSCAPSPPATLWDCVVADALQRHEDVLRTTKRHSQWQRKISKELLKYHTAVAKHGTSEREIAERMCSRMAGIMGKSVERRWRRIGNVFYRQEKVNYEIQEQKAAQSKQEEMLKETEKLTTQLIESVLGKDKWNCILHEEMGGKKEKGFNEGELSSSTLSSSSLPFLFGGDSGDNEGRGNEFDETKHLKLFNTEGGKRPLRHYQRSALKWLILLYSHNLNAILADEMGLGKTVQTIALLCYMAEHLRDWGPHLIVVPTAVLLNWEMEFYRWAPGLRVLTYIGSKQERKKLREGWSKEGSFDVCITSYNLVVNDRDVFRRKAWGFLVLDEAHHIKNFASQKWQALYEIQTQYRLLLTGTPLQNNIMELWSLFHFLLPHATAFNSHEEFQQWYSDPMNDMVSGRALLDELIVRRLQALFRPFLLRRLKKDVEPQLPKKTEKVIYCSLSVRQRTMYDEFMDLKETKERIKSNGYAGIFGVILSLRKVCNHPDLFEERPIVSPFVMPHYHRIEMHLPAAVVSIIPERNKKEMGVLYGALPLRWIPDGFTQRGVVSDAQRRRRFQAERFALHSNDNNEDNDESWVKKMRDGRRLKTTQENLVKKGNFRAKTKQEHMTTSEEESNKASKLALNINLDNFPPFVIQDITEKELRDEVQRNVFKDHHYFSILKIAGSEEFASFPLEAVSSLAVSFIQNVIQPQAEEEDMCCYDPTETGYTTSLLHRHGLYLYPRTKMIPQTSIKAILSPTERMSRWERRRLFTNSFPFFHTRERGEAYSLVQGIHQRSYNFEKEFSRLFGIYVPRVQVLTPAVAPAVMSSSITLVPYGGLRSKIGEGKQRIMSMGDPMGEKYMDGNEYISKTTEISDNNDDKDQVRILRRMDCSNILNSHLHKAYTMPEVSDMLPLTTSLYHGGIMPARTTFSQWKKLLTTQKLSSSIITATTKLSTRKTPVFITAQQSAKNDNSWVCPAGYLVRSGVHSSAAFLSSGWDLATQRSLNFPDKAQLVHDSGKFQVLAHLLPQLKAEGHRALIFSQFTVMLDLIQKFLARLAIPSIRIDGTTKADERQIYVERFNGDERITCMVLSTRSGGIGLNLTGADTVIFYDSDWNPTIDLQAQDRVHRIGQTRSVTVYRLICNNTIEEKILTKARERKRLQNLVISSGEFNKTAWEHKAEVMQEVSAGRNNDGFSNDASNNINHNEYDAEQIRISFSKRRLRDFFKDGSDNGQDEDDDVDRDEGGEEANGEDAVDLRRAMDRAEDEVDQTTRLAFDAEVAAAERDEAMMEISDLDEEEGAWNQGVGDAGAIIRVPREAGNSTEGSSTDNAAVVISIEKQKEALAVKQRKLAHAKKLETPVERLLLRNYTALHGNKAVHYQEVLKEEYAKLLSENS